MAKILKQNSTHKAVEENGLVNLYLKGSKKWKTREEYLYCLGRADEFCKDDLLPIFDELEETTRWLIAEAKEEFGLK